MKTFADYRITIPHGASGEVDTICPECSAERKKKNARCLSVNMVKETWFCHHCGWSGGLADGGRKSDFLHWRKPVYRKPEELPKADLNSDALAWFQKRGVTEEVLIRNKVSLQRVYMPQIEDHTNAIAFPYWRDGELVNVKYRDGRKNFRMEAGAERILYGLDDINDDCLIWVEGEIDKLSVEVAGFKSCVSVPDGAPTPNTKNYASKFDFLESALAKIDPVKKHIIAVDADEPGQRLEQELIRRLGPEKCFRVEWPEDVKDANDALIKLGSDALETIIHAAEQVPVKGVFELRHFSQDIDRLYEHGLPRGLSTGWDSLNHLYTVKPGQWTLVTGIPSHGKSSWLDNLLVNLAELHGFRTAYFSPENQPIQEHASRVISKVIGLPFDKGYHERMTPDQKNLGKRFVDEHFAWILPDEDDSWSLDHILEIARALVFQKGIQGLVIDPWNELDHSSGESTSETNHISKMLTVIRRFARAHSVHVWVVVHPTKLPKDVDGKYPVPTPYDCAGSAHWRNKADNSITIYRHVGEDDKPIDVHVQKVRFKEIGKVGKAELWYDKPTGRYMEDAGYGMPRPVSVKRAEAA